MSTPESRLTPEDPSRISRNSREIKPASLIFRNIQESMGEFERLLASRLEVNATDLEAMQHLIQAGSLSPSALATKLRISTAATTLVIDRLEKVGHAHRKAHPSDRRSVNVIPNEASVTQTFESILPLIYGVDAVLDDFSVREQAIIESYLTRVAAVYRRLIDEPRTTNSAHSPDKT